MATLNFVRMLFGVTISVVNCIYVPSEQLKQHGKLIIYFIIVTLNIGYYSVKMDIAGFIETFVAYFPGDRALSLYQILM